jgi:hypothetical protein
MQECATRRKEAAANRKACVSLLLLLPALPSERGRGGEGWRRFCREEAGGAKSSTVGEGRGEMTD